MKKILVLALLAMVALAWSGPARAQTCANPCTTPQVHVVYYGATAVGPSIVQAAKNLYGQPIKDCNNNIQTYRCKRDLDGNAGNGAETCVQFYVGQNKGSCEGVQALDRKETNFNVCDPNGPGGTAGRRLLTGLLDETGTQLYANFSGSDVGYGLCEPVVTAATILRPSVFDDTETKAFVTPFAFIANRNIETVLPASKKPAPASCPYGAGDCVNLQVGITKDQGKAIFGNNNNCDWRWIDPDVTETAPLNIGTVMRNRLSGTRRNFNATVLETLNPGQGNIYVAGSGDMVARVNTNAWCGTNASECGENQSTGATGGGAVSSACTTGATVIGLGMLGSDRLIAHDNGTPADPFDDYAIRGASGDNYDVLDYNGEQFNKANVECGRYEFWSSERMYYDNDATPDPNYNNHPGYFFPPGSVKENAVIELINQTSVDAATDTTIVANSQMYVSRSKDGSPIFPSRAFSAAVCARP